WLRAREAARRERQPGLLRPAMGQCRAREGAGPGRASGQADRPVGHVLAFRLHPAHLGLGNRLAATSWAGPGPRVVNGVDRAVRAPAALGAVLDEELLRPRVDQASARVILVAELLECPLADRIGVVNVDEGPRPPFGHVLLFAVSDPRARRGKLDTGHS